MTETPSSDVVLPLIPPWMQGTWVRRSIRRADADGVLGPADSSVKVLYIQTPLHFVDVRRPEVGNTGVLAFGGVATVVPASGADPGGRVSWHACLDIDSEADPAVAWTLVDKGTPAATEDVGDFTPMGKLEEDIWLERDPGGTLEEVWQRVDNGQGQFLSARRGTALFVVAGDYFAFAQQDQDVRRYVAGRSAGWVVELSAFDKSQEGHALVLPGRKDDWSVMSYGTIAWPPEAMAFTDGCD